MPHYCILFKDLYPRVYRVSALSYHHQAPLG
ncbi:BgTH12-03386 [Blumeria graminis f. sp. triticale]|uniref:Bgt-51859 n=2 Tax=Blumeria graminis TaxID=34373 RepID=A0A9X9L8T4_BLUGR|nr:BgTH12-03386 [Blumeria graminis f. sp. triticale]VCU39380.1 Bgt-51859 [Blumeria graminis f. sp. tritici]